MLDAALTASKPFREPADNRLENSGPSAALHRDEQEDHQRKQAREANANARYFSVVMPYKLEFKTGRRSEAPLEFTFLVSFIAITSTPFLNASTSFRQ
jgi:hypothetical protein